MEEEREGTAWEFGDQAGGWPGSPPHPSGQGFYPRTKAACLVGRKGLSRDLPQEPTVRAGTRWYLMCTAGGNIGILAEHIATLDLMHVCMCVCVCVCVFAYVHVHLCVCVYMCVCMHVCSCVCIYVCTYMYVCMCVHACAHTCVCVLCVYTCVYARVYVCIYVFVYMCVCVYICVWCVCVYSRHLLRLTAAAKTIDQWWLRTLGLEPDTLGFESGRCANQRSLLCLVWGSRGERL